MKLTSTLTRIDYVVIDFSVLWVFVSKVKLLRLRETSVISSYITSLSIEYLYKFRFFGLWPVYISVFLILFFFAKYVCSHEMISMSIG